MEVEPVNVPSTGYVADTDAAAVTTRCRVVATVLVCTPTRFTGHRTQHAAAASRSAATPCMSARLAHAACCAAAPAFVVPPLFTPVPGACLWTRSWLRPRMANTSLVTADGTVVKHAAASAANGARGTQCKAREAAQSSGPR